MSLVNMLEKVRSMLGYNVGSIAAFYAIVFTLTFWPSIALVGVAVVATIKSGWKSKKTKFLIALAVLVWFSPSLSTLIYAILVGAPWPVYFVLGGVVMVGVRSLWKRVPSNTKVAWKKLLNEISFYMLLRLGEHFLKVVYLSPDDTKAQDLIASFRGQYVTWAGGASGLTKEMDRYDFQESTVHIAVFWPTLKYNCMIGYGRLLFGAHQLQEKYALLIEGEVIYPEQMVEVSRLVVAPSFRGRTIRGTNLSAVIQLLIYRKFFQACEENKVTEWWAVLGSPLHQLLRRFGFPFVRVNNREGEDEAGRYYAVQMNVEDGRRELRKLNPRLYAWFRRLENRPVRVRRVNGRETATHNALPEVI